MDLPVSSFVLCVPVIFADSVKSIDLVVANDGLFA